MYRTYITVHPGQQSIEKVQQKAASRLRTETSAEPAHNGTFDDLKKRSQLERLDQAVSSPDRQRGDISSDAAEMSAEGASDCC